MNPRLTIAMPVYNVAKTLLPCIYSLLKQTYADWELLLCDDCSSDETLALASRFNDPRVVLWTHKERGGLALRLNECVDRARGEILARMDGDDLAYPERFETQLRFLDAHSEVDLVSCGALVFGENGVPFGKSWCDGGDHAVITRHPLRGFPMTHVGWVGRLAWFRQHRYDTRALYAQDQELLYRAFRTSCYASMPDILVGVREERLDLGKMFRRRKSWMRYMGWHHSGVAGLPARSYVASVLGFKAALDAAAILSGLDYKILKHRARPLTKAESQRWSQVWAEVKATENGLNQTQPVPKTPDEVSKTYCV